MERDAGKIRAGEYKPRGEITCKNRVIYMAVDMFIKIASVDGESKDSKHGKEIDVLAWSWGLSNSGSAHTGGGAGSGKVNVQDLSFTKWVDSATPKLVKAACDGSHFDEALLTVRKAGGSPVEYIKLKLTEVLVSSISTGGSGGEDRLTENVTLNFGKFSLDYTPQDDKGKPLTAVNTGWDIAGNAQG
jgi:type VI secretion system secreted protein Hcp